MGKLFEPKLINPPNQNNKPRIIPRTKVESEKETMENLNPKQKENTLNSIANKPSRVQKSKKITSSSSSRSSTMSSSSSDQEHDYLNVNGNKNKHSHPRKDSPKMLAATVILPNESRANQGRNPTTVDIVSSTSSSKPTNGHNNTAAVEPNKSYVYVNYSPKASEQNGSPVISNGEKTNNLINNGTSNPIINSYLRANNPLKAETYLIQPSPQQQQATTAATQKPTLTLKPKTKGFYF